MTSSPKSVSPFSQTNPFTVLTRAADSADSAEAEPRVRKQLQRPSFKQETRQKAYEATKEGGRERCNDIRKQQRAEWIRSKWLATKREFYTNYENIQDQALSHKDAAVQMFPMWDQETADFFTGYCEKVDVIMRKHLDLFTKQDIKKIKTSFTTELTDLMKDECIPAVMRQALFG